MVNEDLIVNIKFWDLVSKYLLPLRKNVIYQLQKHAAFAFFCTFLNLPPSSLRTSRNIWVQIGNSSSSFIYHPRQWGFIYQGKRYLDLLNADITMRRIVIQRRAVSMLAILHQRYCWIVNRRVVARPSHAG